MKPIRRAKIFLTFLQAALIGALFLPAAKLNGSGVLLNTLGLARHYADLGRRLESIFYAAVAFGSPLATAVCVWCLNKRNGFGAAAWLSALTALNHACFYSAVRVALYGSITPVSIRMFVVALAVFSLFVGIYGYLLVGPAPSGRKLR